MEFSDIKDPYSWLQLAWDGGMILVVVDKWGNTIFNKIAANNYKWHAL